MARRAPTAPTNGHSSRHVPGVYEHVLRKICEMRVHDAIGSDWLVASDDPVATEKWEQEHAERFAAEWESRAGRPVRCQLWLLPRELPPPFDVRYGRRMARVDPDDTITLLPRPVRDDGR